MGYFNTLLKMFGTGIDEEGGTVTAFKSGKQFTMSS